MNETIINQFLNSNAVDGLRSEIDRLKQQRDTFSLLQKLSPITGFVILVAGLTVWYFTDLEIFLVVGIGYAVISAILFFSPLTYSLDQRISGLESDLLLEAANTENIEQRAERLFRSHEHELKRYYSQNLNQSRWVFFVGLLCLAAGFGVIAATFYVIFFSEIVNSGIDEKIIVSSFGFLSGLMINFIGVIFLKMFAGILQSLNVFHERLVQTNRVYFANFLISKIPNPEERAQAILKLAVHEGENRNIEKES